MLPKVQLGQTCLYNFTTTVSGCLAWSISQCFHISIAGSFLPTLHSIPFQPPFSASSSDSFQIMHAHMSDDRGWLAVASFSDPHLWRCSHFAKCFCRTSHTGVRTLVYWKLYRYIKDECLLYYLT